MEQERLNRLKACPDVNQDVNKCPDYFDLHKKMIGMVNDRRRAVVDLFEHVDVNWQ